MKLHFSKHNAQQSNRSDSKRIPALAAVGALIASGCALALSGCGSNSDSANTLYVYNWGEYLDPETVEMFEEETGIHVVYDEFETNEVMFPKIDSNPSQYDVICPSDYMIAKMAENDLLAPLDYSKIPNAKNIGDDYWKQSEAFDPGNVYSVPYCWGTVGILYNTKTMDEVPDSWDYIWDPKYTDDVLMQDSVRDLFGVALKRLGYSLNSTDEQELQEAKQSLIEQKPIVQAYVVDEVRDKMVGGEAKMGVIFSGEAEYTRELNPDMDYVIPKEGTNVWIDSWVVTKESKHKDAAMQWINFMCRDDIALKNFEYIWYSTPNEAAKALLDEETQNNEILFPDLSKYNNLEAYDYLGDEVETRYFELWKEVKSA